MPVMHENHQLYETTLDRMESWLLRLLSKVPPPIEVRNSVGFLYRYAEKSPQQAIGQKLARVVSTLDAAHHLVLLGFVQEQAALHRMLDELTEDVHFLCYGILNEWEALHTEYLEYFYMEDFTDPADPSGTLTNRPTIRRQKIRASIAKHGDDPHGAIKAGRAIGSIFSGFVHAASPHIMDMYSGGRSPKFHVRGMLGTPRVAEHLWDTWNYFFRGISTFGMAAYAFGDVPLGNEIVEYDVEFKTRSKRGV